MTRGLMTLLLERGLDYLREVESWRPVPYGGRCSDSAKMEVWIAFVSAYQVEPPAAIDSVEGMLKELQCRPREVCHLVFPPLRFSMEDEG